MRTRLIAPLLLFCALSATAQALAETSDRTVIILIPRDNKDQSDQLRLAVEAHLSGLQVEVRAVDIETMPTETGGSQEIAAVAQEAHRALTVIWLSPEGDAFFILTPTVDEYPRARKVPDAGEGWVARCETMASIVHSEVTPLVAELVEAPAEDEPEPESKEAEPEEAPKEEVDSSDDRRPVHLLVGAGYVPAPMSPDGPFLNAATLSLGLVIGEHFQLDFGLDFLQRASLNVPANDAELVRWPLRPGLVLMLPFTNLDLGVRLGAVFDVWYLSGPDYDLADGNVKDRHMDPGLVATVMARYKLLSWFGLFAELGADIYFTDSSYLLNDETLLERGPAQMRAVVGLAFLLALN
ncbi:MAG: hypothetical protein GY854_31765 [Deltaproteobacteria bacterium]|nr:hypothetical protein [Deltaproteobacteria bacterium]